MGNSWIDQRIHFIDFEGNAGSGIIEYGVVTIVQGRIEQVRTRLCGATGSISLKDTDVHGIREEAVRGAAPIADDWEFFAGLRETGPLAAHFSGAEHSLIKSVWPYPRASPDFVRPGEKIVDWGPWVDSARLYPQLSGDTGPAGLEEVVLRCGLKKELTGLAERRCPAGRRRYHAALHDALAGALVLLRLARDPRAAALSTAQLIALSTLDPGKRDALNQRELF